MEKILFHHFKHHIDSGKKWITTNSENWTRTTDLQLKSLGNSQFDYYIGKLLVEDIKLEVYEYLNTNQLLDCAIYKEWLDKQNGYREIELSDSSRWVLRFVDKQQFVHLHPSRYSKHTIRLKANVLKTVFCTLLFHNWQEDEFDIGQVNHCRTNYLQLSAIDESENHEELQRIFQLFTNKV